MSYFSLDHLPKKERIRLIGEFYDVISSLKNREEVRLFFKDLLTPSEIGNLMRRIDIALLLILGFSYDEIHSFLGVSKDKIMRVHKKLLYSGEGYRRVVQRLLEKRKKRKIKEIKYHRKNARKIERPDLEMIKRKYSLPFLLVNLIDEFSDSLEAISRINSPRKETEEFYKNNRRKRKEK